MDKEAIFEYDDVLKACEQGNKLNAIKLLKDKTGWNLIECKLCVDSFIEEYFQDQFSNNRNEQEPNITLVKAIHIESKSSEIEKEIQLLYQNIETLDEQKIKKIDEIANLKSVLDEKKLALSDLINNIYSSNSINNNIAEFYTLLNTQYYNKYNSNLVDDEAKFRGEFYKIIKESSVESIISKLHFKHNSGKLKAKGWFYILILTGIAVLLFILAYENFRPYDAWQKYKTGNGRSYNYIGWFINAVGGFLALAGLGKLLTLSLVPNEDVKRMINSNNDPNFKELLNYLNSIHRLPEEIKKLIK